MSELPNGWAVVPLRDLASVRLGKMLDKAKNSGSLTPYLRNVNVRWFSFDLSDVAEMLADDNDRETFSVRNGDLFVCEGGEPGRCSIWQTGNSSLIYQKALHRVRPSAALLPLTLAYQFRLDACTHRLSEYFTGTTIKHLTQESLQRYQVLLPPVQEQERITEKLDTMLTRVDACRDRLARVGPVLKRFRQSVLMSATSGRLTEDWRVAEKLGAWEINTLTSICQENRVITYGVVKLGDETVAGVPCLRTSNVRWLNFELAGLKRITPELSAEYARTVLQGGEVLVNVRGTLGGVAVTQSNMSGWNVSREVAVVPIDKTVVVPQFAALWIASDESQRWLAKVEKGVAYVGVNIEDLRNLPIRVPSIDEQTEIVRRVNLLFAFADRLEARLQKAQAAADRLTPALLAKAFRGELVPQDPNDEPAAELLKRLAAQRAQAPVKRGRKKAVVVEGGGQGELMGI